MKDRLCTTLVHNRLPAGYTLPLPPPPTQPTEVWAYLRVSTSAQDDARQEHDILRYANSHGLTVTRFLRCSVSSRRAEEERSINVLKDAADRGTLGTVLFAELSRLGRSVGEIARLVAYFVERGVELVFIKEGMHLGVVGAALDISTKVTLTVFSLLAEIERDLISERTKSALAARKAAGVKLGRPMGKSKLDDHEPTIREWLRLGVTQRAICRHLGCAEPTLIKWLKRRRPQWDKAQEAKR
jgi:DNA invertase Pin-like site-specific DNA recombinase